MGPSHRQLPRPRPSLVRDVGIVVAAALLGLAIASYSDIPNPDYAEAVTLVTGLEGVHAATVDGTPLEEAVAANPEARLHVVERAGEPMYFLTHQVPVARFCYGLRWRIDDQQPQIGKFGARSLCAPSPSGSFVGEMAGLPPGGDQFYPSETATAWWFVPSVVVLVMVGLTALLRIGLEYLRNRSRTRHAFRAPPKR